MKKVFIDGSIGTTGLRIAERLSSRSDIQLLTLSEDKRKDETARAEMLNSADIAFLCLPDEAAREAVSLISGETVVIDTSTAHRTNDDFAYGFAELGSDFLNKIKVSKRIAVPGCHASGFIALVQPLVKAGLVSASEKLCCHSITGYSGGGKKMIAEYSSQKPEEFSAPRQYGLSQNHKHLPEMVKICGLENAPVFCPIVADFYSGMEVTVPLFASQVKGTVQDIINIYKNLYTGDIVYYSESTDIGGMCASASLSGKDSMAVSVYGNEERILLTARYDNLGKGASGAAVEVLNILLGVSPTEGLVL